MESKHYVVADIITQEDSEASSVQKPFALSDPDPSPSSKEHLPEVPVALPQDSFFMELIKQVKGSLSAMMTLAFFSRDKFKDAELGQHFYEIVSEDLEKTISLLNCYRNYITLEQTDKRANTVHTVIEKVMNEHQDLLKKKAIHIIKKQFDEDLPETAMPEVHLQYVLDALIQYTIRTLPSGGSMGFLTRTFDGAEKMENQNELQKNAKYVEILVVASHHPDPQDSLGSQSEVPIRHIGGQLDLVLELVKTMTRKNRGALIMKSYDDKALTFVSLILPVERRKVIRFPSAKTGGDVMEGHYGRT
jgi:hypothetical protein